MKAQNDSHLIEQLLNNRKDLFDTILRNPAKYRIQIIYTQINRDKSNKPTFKTYKFRANPKEYFYPASVVKLPIAILALEKLNKLQIKGLNKHTRLRIDSAEAPQTPVYIDTTAKTGYPSIAQYIHKLFVVSDNDAYNRLYEFLGQQYINETLWKKGYKNVLITHRLSAWGFDEESNRYTNPISFYQQGGGTIYQQGLVHNAKPFAPKLPHAKIGKGHIVNQDGKKQLVNKPMDMSKRNYFALETMHEILKTLMFPEVTPTEHKFLLSESDYQLLYRSMSMYPRESKYPIYNKKEHKDNFVKFLMFGEKYDDIPENIRVFNKVGLSYGFMTDNAYIVDFEHKVEFLLSATIYTNENEILNDDQYDYKKIGFPFMERLGRVIYWYERNRPKKYAPDLSKFRISYKQ